MLRRPLLLRPRPVIVRPDDFVEEDVSPEALVKQHLTVVHLAVIDVEVHAAIGAEHPVGLSHPWLDEPQKVIEEIAVSHRSYLHRLVTLTRKAHPVPVLGLLCADLRACLCVPRIERRVDVDEINRSGRK